MKSKSHIIYSLALLFSVVLLSCNQQNKKSNSEKIAAHDVLAQNMEPFDLELPKLSNQEIENKKAKIDAFYKKNWPSSNNNLSFLVAQNGQIIYEKYEGYANMSKKKPITLNTPMHIASVSKVLTATAVLKLVNTGKIQLDQRVNTILKNFPYPEITIRTLLNHRTGMRNYAYFTSEKGVWDRHKTITNQEVLEVMANKNIKLECKPDTRFSYCNTNYAMLALIIEKITGESYSKAMKKIIFDPLGMKNTFVFDNDKHRDTVTLSYKITGRQIGYDYLDAVYGDKNIFSTPRDLLKFDMARNAPYFLKPELKKQIYVGYSNEHKGVKNYGLGIRMINWKGGQNFYFHNGWWHGNMSSYVSLINENVTMIALTNKCQKQVYKIRDLSPLFGDYPFKSDHREMEE